MYKNANINKKNSNFIVFLNNESRARLIILLLFYSLQLIFSNCSRNRNYKLTLFNIATVVLELCSYVLI